MNLNEEIIEKIAPFVSKNEATVEEDQDSLIKILGGNFKFLGSKINWSQTKNHWSENYNKGNMTIDNSIKLKLTKEYLSSKGFNEAIGRLPNILYINDSSLDFGIKISKNSFWHIFEI